MNISAIFSLFSPRAPSSSESRGPIGYEEAPCATTEENVHIVALRIFSLIGAVATGVIYVATANPLIGIISLGLTLVSIYLISSFEDDPVHRTATLHLHTNAYTAPPQPSVFMQQPPQLIPSLPPHAPSFYTPLCSEPQTFSQPPPALFPPYRPEGRIQVGTAPLQFTRAPGMEIPDERRIQAGDPPLTRTNPEGDQRIPVGTNTQGAPLSSGDGTARVPIRRIL